MQTTHITHAAQVTQSTQANTTAPLFGGLLTGFFGSFFYLLCLLYNLILITSFISWLGLIIYDRKGINRQNIIEQHFLWLYLLYIEVVISVAGFLILSSLGDSSLVVVTTPVAIVVFIILASCGHKFIKNYVESLYPDEKNNVVGDNLKSCERVDKNISNERVRVKNISHERAWGKNNEISREEDDTAQFTEFNNIKRDRWGLPLQNTPNLKSTDNKFTKEGISIEELKKIYEEDDAEKAALAAEEEANEHEG